MPRDSTPQPEIASGGPEAPPTQRKRTFIDEIVSSSYDSGFQGKIITEQHQKEMDSTHRVAANISELMAEVGLRRPPVLRGRTEAFRTDLLSLRSGFADISASDETPMSRTHAAQLNQIVDLMVQHIPLMPESSKARRFLALGSTIINQAWHEDHQTSAPQIKIDACIVKSGVTAQQLKEVGGVTKVHIAGEAKTASGTSFLGQSLKYATAHAFPGARWNVTFAWKGTKFFVLLYTAKRWAFLWEGDYYAVEARFIDILAWLLSDAAVDTSLEEQMRTGLPLLSSDAITRIYNEGLTPFDERLKSRSTLRIPKQTEIKNADIARLLPGPFFSSRQAFGAKTKVWDVETTVDWHDDSPVNFESTIIKISHLRPTKAINAAYYVSQAAENNSEAAGQGWLPIFIGVYIHTNSEIESYTSDGAGRLPVVYVTAGPAGATWQELKKDTALSLLWRSFRDVIRGIYLLRPLRVRDVSLANVLFRIPAMFDKNSAEEQRRLEPVLSWQDEWPEACGALFDFDRARGTEPSDFERRVARQAGVLADPDESLDDAWTGTLPYLSRAQVALNARADEATTEEHAELLKKHGKHQTWHDLESLCYCVLFKSFERWRYLPPVRAVLDTAYVNAPYRVAYRWLDQHASDLRDAVRGCKSQIAAEELKLAEAVKKGFDKLATAFKDKTVPTDEAEPEEEMQTLFRTLAPEEEEALFLAVVKDAIAVIRELDAIETTMDQERDGHVTRRRRVSAAPPPTPGKRRRVA